MPVGRNIRDVKIWSLRGVMRVAACFVLAISMLPFGPSAAQAGAYCDLLLEAEINIASSVGRRSELQRQWLPLAEALSKNKPAHLLDADPHHNLIAALLTGSFDEALTALGEMRTAMPVCFKVEGLAEAEMSGEHGSSDAGMDPHQGPTEMPETHETHETKSLMSTKAIALIVAISAVSMAIGFGLACLMVKRKRSLARKAPRLSCLVPATLSAPSSSGPGSVVNISTVGAQVQRAGVELKVGDKVVVETDLFEASGKVAWASPQFIGLRFDQRIDETVVEQAVQFAPEVKEDSPKEEEDPPVVEFTSLRRASAA